MVNQQFCIDSKELVQHFLVVVIRWFPDRTAGNISHGIQAMGLKFLGISVPHPPEVGKRAVIPEQPAVGELIELCNADAILIRLDVLCHDVHGHFTKIEIWSDTGSCGDPHRVKHIQDHLPSQFPWCKAISAQIVSDVHKHFVDGVRMDILRRDIFEIDLKDAGAVVHIELHARRSNQVVQRQLRVSL